jgi:MFS family permease
VAGAAAQGAVTGRTGDAAGGRADPGETQPVLNRPGTGQGTAAEGGRRARFQTFRSLSTRNYRLFASGQVVSNTGTWMQRVAQDWLVLELTHGSGTALGIASGLQFLPQLLFSLWGGVIADRYRKRSILLATQTIMGMLALVLGVLALTGAVAVWQVYLLAFALGLVAVVDNPARQTFVAEMVGSEGMANAIALNGATFNLARIVGPAVAGLVIAAVGIPLAFLINAASYGAVLIGLKLMRESELRPLARAPKARGQLMETFSYVRARPDLWLTLVLVFFVATFGMNFQVTTALMSKGVFGTGASLFGLASAVFALGALGGALVAARRARPSMRLMLATAFAFGVLEVATGLMPVFWSFLAMLVPTGMAVLMFSTAANSTTQLSTTPEVRGRVMGLYMLVFLGGTPLGSPLVGWAAEQFGPRTGLVGGGVISAAAAAGVAVLLARARGTRLRTYLRPAALARALA